MKNIALIFALILTGIVTSFAQVGSYSSTKFNTTKVKPTPKYTIPTAQNIKNFRKAIARPNCADPMAADIKFQIVRRDNQFRGRVRISGTVTNNGLKNFQSGRNQQSIILYEIVPGARPREVARRNFINLAAGQSINVSFVRNWNISSPAEGEFPPSYRVCLTYDPDIYIDGNDNNNDCNQRNNCKTENGSQISRLF